MSDRASHLPPGHTVDTLLEQDRLQEAREELQRLVVEGMESGDPVEATPEFWERLRADLHRQAGLIPPRKSA